VGHERVKPGLRQTIDRIVYPRGTRHSIATAKVLY
jgi:hypothetical protein